MINHKRNTGSYYTPAYLASFISKRVLSHFEDRTKITILEPSVGDGAFVEELAFFKNISIDLAALDIDHVELKKASNKWINQESAFIDTDFLEYSSANKFDAIIWLSAKENKLSAFGISRAIVIAFTV